MPVLVCQGNAKTSGFRQRKNFRFGILPELSPGTSYDEEMECVV